MNVIFIWVKNIVVLLFSLFFLIIGINTMLGAFKLNNPLEFLMYFFSASLLILVCIVGIIYFVFRFFPNKQQDGIVNDETK
jgi:predicted RND superfamily exporter protein